MSCEVPIQQRSPPRRSRPRCNSKQLKNKKRNQSHTIATVVRLLLCATFLVVTYLNYNVVLERISARRKKEEKFMELANAIKLETQHKSDIVNKSLAALRLRAYYRSKRTNAPGLSLGDMTKQLHAVELKLHGGSNKVVIVGVHFIMTRDFDIWDQTFTRAGWNAIRSSKKKLVKGQHSDWKVLKCLDLFDGKSHCIDPKKLLDLQPYQRVSRLYGLRKTLWNKDRFCETLSFALEGFDNLREFVFPCWLLPQNYKSLIRAAKGEFKSRSFILKPTDRGEGNGIVVMDHWRSLVNWKSKFPDVDEVVVQTYLPNPFLINGRKWDMRTYVLVTSIHPLRCYMYRDGLVRFASSQYDKSAKAGGKQTSFLTNTSVNKKSGVAVDELTWPFPKVYRWLQRNGHDPDLLWSRIEAAVTQMLLASEPSFARIFHKLESGFTCKNCYQLLGVDVIVDDDMTPRVIEVNGEPSMQLTGEVNSHYDYTKTSMTRDLVELVFENVKETPSVAKQLASDFMELELEGYSVGYYPKCDKQSFDFCLHEDDMEYFLQAKREFLNMGGFRNLYPTHVGGNYDSFVQHLKTKFTMGKSQSKGSFRVHELATLLNKISRSKGSRKNAIDDPNYHE